MGVLGWRGGEFFENGVLGAEVVDVRWVRYDPGGGSVLTHALSSKISRIWERGQRWVDWVCWVCEREGQSGG